MNAPCTIPELEIRLNCRRLMADDPLALVLSGLLPFGGYVTI